MPEKPFEAFELLGDRGPHLVRHLLIPGGLWQAFGGLLHHGQAHRDMEPIEQMLGLGIEVELEVAHGVAAIGEKGDLLVELVALRLEHLEEPAFGFLVIGLHEGKTLAGDRLLGLFPAVKGQETLARDHLEAALLPLRFHVAAIDPHGQRAIGHW